jgi:heterodisulfide reductase subunit C
MGGIFGGSGADKFHKYAAGGRMEIKRIVKFEAERDLEFAHWMRHTVGGEKVHECLQCGLCSGNCPLSTFMDNTPRRLLYLSREGFKEEVLKSRTIWLCTSCYACMVECPKNINMTNVMYALKERALREGYYPKGFLLPVMARQFARMARQNGRVTESWLVVRVFLRVSWARLLGMSKLGMRLMRTGRMSYFPEKVRNRKDMARLADSVKATRKELAI